MLCTVCNCDQPNDCFSSFLSRGKEYQRNECGDCVRAKSAARARQRRALHPRASRAKTAGTKYLPPRYSHGILRSNAAQAFEHWVTEVLSAQRADQYFISMGCPWDNPRLTKAARLDLVMAGKVKVSEDSHDGVRIPLNGKYASGAAAFTLVDKEMYQELMRFKWQAKPNGKLNCVYAVRTTAVDGRTITVRMHREVLGLGGASDEPMDVDHINHNPLDNRARNLRLVARMENTANRWAA